VSDVIAVAVSGGRDSTALLHATCRAARGTAVQVVALHVHHGLMPQADAWLVHLQSQCRRWHRQGLPVELKWRRLTGAPAPAESVEAWARRGRYRALGEMAHESGAGCVLLAHHRQDQAETFLLQALRLGSPRGLASMPQRVQRDGLTWLRPWLEHDAQGIEAYVKRWRLRHVQDDSNADPRFARSRLRTQVWPVLRQAFPQVDERLCAAAARAQETADCLRELADADAELCVDAAAGLSRTAWLRLTPARRVNLLRHWLADTLGQGAPETLVRRLLSEWPVARGGARWPAPAGALQHRADHLRRLAGPASLERSS
jgi:tRNA(Ile)-lysidine synthase